MYRIIKLSPFTDRMRHAPGSPKRTVGILAAASLIAAASPAFAQARPAALESVRVPAGKEAISFKTSLDTGELFLLKATGTIKVGGSQVDAEYGGFGTGTAGQDRVAGVDVGVDVAGQAASTPNAPAMAAAGRKHWFGSYRRDHTYYQIVTGAGRPLILHLLTSTARGGSGAITVSLFRLSAAALPPPLETLQVPVMERTVATALTTRLPNVYLLQCSGSERVGGLNLGQGDAEYMDYTADGTGVVDIGDANTDYGLGVDEADQKVSPRLHKWEQAWRSDHTYYQLFQGTGRPIRFFFYDVKDGYGDNSPTDTLTVRVFSAP